MLYLKQKWLFSSIIHGLCHKCFSNNTAWHCEPSSCKDATLRACCSSAIFVLPNSIFLEMKYQVASSLFVLQVGDPPRSQSGNTTNSRWKTTRNPRTPRMKNQRKKTLILTVKAIRTATRKSGENHAIINMKWKRRNQRVQPEHVRLCRSTPLSTR